MIPLIENKTKARLRDRVDRDEKRSVMLHRQLGSVAVEIYNISGWAQEVSEEASGPLASRRELQATLCGIVAAAQFKFFDRRRLVIFIRTFIKMR